jgi:hypothetical protein
VTARRWRCVVCCGALCLAEHLYLAVSAPGAAETGRRPTGPRAAPSVGESGEGPHLRAYSCSAAAGPPPPNSSESRRAPPPAPPATRHTSALHTPLYCTPLARTLYVLYKTPLRRFSIYASSMYKIIEVRQCILHYLRNK